MLVVITLLTAVVVDLLVDDVNLSLLTGVVAVTAVVTDDVLSPVVVAAIVSEVIFFPFTEAACA